MSYAHLSEASGRLVAPGGPTGPSLVVEPRSPVGSSQSGDQRGETGLRDILSGPHSAYSAPLTDISESC